MPKWKPLKGMKFGKLTVLEDFRSEERHYHMCKCICDCENHNIKDIRACRLLSGNTIDCGCGTHERRVEGSTKHGFKGTPIYNRWETMKRRCYDKNFVGYQNYGGRGIKVCNEWKDSFEAFKKDMYESFLIHAGKYGEDNTTLDRIDVNKNYCKDNCRWATRQVQGLNKRNTRKYLFKGKEYNIRELTKIWGEKDKELLRGRLKNNKYDVDYVYKRWYLNE